MTRERDRMLTFQTVERADGNAVKAIVEHLLKEGSLEGWFALHDNTRYIDMLMAAHNLHKQIVDDLARRAWEEQQTPPALTYRKARDTWKSAMDHRINNGLPPETITEADQDAKP